MDSPALGATGPAMPAVPRHVADLRPTADAAALCRDPRAAIASAVLPAVALPAPTSQAAAVSRSLIGVTPVEQTGRTVAPPERVLKPWGVPMLPAEAKEASATPKPTETDSQGPRSGAGRDSAGQGEQSA